MFEIAIAKYFFFEFSELSFHINIITGLKYKIITGNYCIVRPYI